MKAAIEAGNQIPASVLDAPELRFDLILFWSAFWSLSTCRQVGMGVGPIMWTAIKEYAEYFQIDDLEEFYFLISQMDAVYLDHARSEIKK